MDLHGCLTARNQDRFNRDRWLGLGCLSLLLSGLGCIIIPAHWNTIWSDWSFTGWSAPFANRLTDGAKLYSFGLHSPMPPLSFVLIKWLFPHNATWFQGNCINYLVEVLLVLALFWGFAREWGPKISWIGVLASLPVFLADQKSLLYDSMAQFLVVCSAISVASLLRNDSKNSWFKIILPGIWLGLLLLTKQSTGMGAVGGVTLSLLLLPRGETISRRFINLIAVGAATLLFFCLVALLLRKYVDFGGMIRDVFLTGSQPKGGPAQLAGRLAIFNLQAAVRAIGLGLLLYLITRATSGGVAHWKIWTERFSSTQNNPEQEDFLWLAGILGTVIGLSLVILYVKTGVSLLGTLMNVVWSQMAFNVGFCLVLLSIFVLLAEKFSGQRPANGNDAIPAYAIIFYCSALFHNLSVARFQWGGDDNPIIALAMVLLVAAFMSGGKTKSARNRKLLNAALMSFVVFIRWTETDFAARQIVSAKKSWPDIKHLAGAKMPERAEGLHELVRRVRDFALPQDTVLLLPNDPNLQEWFERPAPKLSCAVIFTDQYWDRYVDEDFTKLRANPPKVVVIGPRDYWRPFTEVWHPHWGAERLIDLVREQMLAKDYDLKSEQPISFENGIEHMDVYVRRN